MKLIELVRRCHYCASDMTNSVSASAYAENPYCSDCLSERLSDASKNTPTQTWVRDGLYATLKSTEGKAA